VNGSIAVLDLSLVGLDDSVRETGKESRADGVPLDGSALMEGLFPLLLLSLIIDVQVLRSLILDLIVGLGQ
jgi:hypothetical protein